MRGSCKSPAEGEAVKLGAEGGIQSRQAGAVELQSLQYVAAPAGDAVHVVDAARVLTSYQMIDSINFCNAPASLSRRYCFHSSSHLKTHSTL